MRRARNSIYELRIEAMAILIAVSALALFFAALPAAEAQQEGKVYRVGFLIPSRRTPETPWYDAFRQGMREAGYLEGQNLVMEPRWADSNPGRLRELAAELVHLKVDAIVTISAAAALAAKDATTAIPIVMSGAIDPVQRGLITSLARPGGNITGSTGHPGAGFSSKGLQLLKEAAPKMSRVALLWNPTNPGDAGLPDELRTVAPALGLTVSVAEVRQAEDLPGAFAAIIQARADGLYVPPFPGTYDQLNTIVDFASAQWLPAIFGDRRFVIAGGLMSYWIDWIALHRHTAYYVDKILKGAKPADLPVEDPTKYELVINLKSAKALGLTIPQSILLRADEVIQ